MATTTRQRLAGGVVIGVAAAAFYLGTQWKGPGLGGSGSGDGGPVAGEPARPSVASSEEPRGAELAGDSAVLVSNAAPPSTQAPLVTVVITGNEYLLSTIGDETTATPALLTEVARAALMARGDSQGIRVRIFRKKDAKAGAKIDLFSKLNEAGIPNEAIQDKREFLD
jgi:hypothetical protein